MPSMFVSSVVRGFQEYREAARRAIGRVRWVAIMSEDQPAGDVSPRTALLREVARADALLLLLGASYGGSGVPSPTEQEAQEAERLGKPVLVMVQEGVEHEPLQTAFIDRVSSGWSAGRYRGSFSTPEELTTEVVVALRSLETELAGAEGGQDAARQRAGVLLETSGPGWSQAPQARLVVVPSGGRCLIPATELNRGAIAESLADLVRVAGLAGALAGFEPSVSASGVEIVERNKSFEGEQLRVRVETDGALMVEGPISGDGQMGGMWVNPARLKDLVRRGLQLAPQLWTTLSDAEVVTTALVQVVLPRAGQRSWGRPSGGSVSMGGMIRLDSIVAPQAPEVVTAKALAVGQPADEIVAQIERAYRDAGAVNA